MGIQHWHCPASTQKTKKPHLSPSENLHSEDGDQVLSLPPATFAPGSLPSHPSCGGEYDVEMEGDDLSISSIILSRNNASDEFLLEGDMVAPKTRNAMTCWSNGCRWQKDSQGKVTIPYTVSRDFSPAEKQKIDRALKSFHSRTCIRFVPHQRQRDYISIVNRNGCWSELGRTGGRQELSLARDGCVYHGVIQHESLHALGFQHEQTRRA